MDKIFYSKSTGGFYSDAIHGNNMPADAKEISLAQHAALLEAQAGGKTIGADSEGFPIALDPQPPTQEELANLRKSEILARLSEIDLQTLRPLRAVYSGTDTEQDHQTLEQLETEAITLRTELATLTN